MACKKDGRHTTDDPGRRTARLLSKHITLTSASTPATRSRFGSARNVTDALKMTVPFHPVSYEHRPEEATRTTTQTSVPVTSADAFHQSRG